MEVKTLVKYVKDNKEYLAHNKKLFDIFEGDLLKYIEAALQNQLSPQAYELAKHRIASINILRRIIDKLSKIYMKSPRRTAMVNGKESPKDQALLDWYLQHSQADVYWSLANEFFNLNKTVTVEPFVDGGMPRMRAIPSDRSLFYSDNKTDPTKPTAWVKLMGNVYDDNAKADKALFYVYTDSQFLPLTEDGQLVNSILLENENPEGVNPVGKIPAIYINRSLTCILPPIDTDVLRMTVLIPVLLSDLNFAAMMQAFSIIYGIDVVQENLKIGPNVFWDLKSDKTTNNKPSVGVIKPEVDISEVVQLIITEFVMWLESKSIKPGSVGDLSGQNLASGVAKIVDEMDTFEDRKKQVQYFKKAENDYWNLIIKHMHPYWRANGLIDTNLDFSENCEIVVEFPEQLPMVDRSKLIDDAIKELQERLTTKKRAIQMINPELSSKEVDELIEAIKLDGTLDISLRDVSEITPDANSIDEESGGKTLSV